jgi:hypothetical protein
MAMNTRDPRAVIEASFADIAPPIPDSERITKRGKRLRFRDNAIRTTVGLVAAIALLAPLVALLDIGGTDHRVPSAGETTTVSSGGVSIDVPAGWEGSFFDVPGFSEGVLIISNRQLPSAVSDAATEVRMPLDSGDALVWMVEYSALCPPCDEFVPADAPPPLTTEALTGYDVTSDVLPRIEPISDHSSSRFLFTTEGRFFDLRIEFGSRQPTEEALAALNRILSSIRVAAPSGLGSVPACSDPGGFLNSSCPDYEWLGSVLRAGGFEVVGDTGTALTASNGALDMNAWIAETMTTPGDYPLWGEVQGTRVAMLSEDIIFWNAEGGRQVWLRVQSPGGQLDAEIVDSMVAASNG